MKPGESSVQRAKPVPVAHFYKMPECNELMRRTHAWGLLAWYHRTWIVPNRGIRGVLRRMWWRVTGNREKLLSPWEQIALRSMAIMSQRALEAKERQAADAAPTNGAAKSKHEGGK